MQFSQANVASIMMLISDQKLTLKESAELIEKVNDECGTITSKVKFSSKTNESLAKHFLTKWLIANNNNINKDELDHFSSQLQRAQATPYQELSICSLAGSLTLVNRFLMALYASGAISESELTELSGEYSVTLKRIFFDIVDECIPEKSDKATKIVVMHMLERSLTQNLSQYFKTVFEQGLVEQFLSNPLAMLEPLRLQVRKEIDLALNLAQKLI
ncbi:hypothetical protein [Vibrio sp. D431a]|uniref:hypothetical protein n=1 Tax=Vibrio sp. D431a TaxID=2837388 RepID=UPI002554655C|nr:hypothetical protein [Vibrio sp. D431a]MDK9793816.1 hypothetical protein [Vibrio sp. D431a]